MSSSLAQFQRGLPLSLSGQLEGVCRALPWSLVGVGGSDHTGLHAALELWGRTVQSLQAQDEGEEEF